MQGVSQGSDLRRSTHQTPPGGSPKYKSHEARDLPHVDLPHDLPVCCCVLTDYTVWNTVSAQ